MPYQKKELSKSSIEHFTSSSAQWSHVFDGKSGEAAASIDAPFKQCPWPSCQAGHVRWDTIHELQHMGSNACSARSAGSQCGPPISVFILDRCWTPTQSIHSAFSLKLCWQARQQQKEQQQPATSLCWHSKGAMLQCPSCWLSVATGKTTAQRVKCFPSAHTPAPMLAPQTHGRSFQYQGSRQVLLI